MSATKRRGRPKTSERREDCQRVSIWVPKATAKLLRQFCIEHDRKPGAVVTAALAGAIGGCYFARRDRSPSEPSAPQIAAGTEPTGALPEPPAA